MKKDMRSICACYFLEKFTLDDSVPVVYNESDGYAYVISRDKGQIRIQYCFVCGGNPSGIFSDSLNKCSCNFVSDIHRENILPILYDDRFHEYRIVDLSGTRETLIHFCFVCGGRMPESTRDENFYEQSQDEVRELTGRLAGVQSIDGIITELGKPDIEYPVEICNGLTNRINGLGNITRAVEYRTVARTFILQVMEDESGKVSYFFAGKMKGHA